MTKAELDSVVRGRSAGSEPAVIQHRAILININDTAEKRSFYEAIRYAWRIDPRRASKAEVILATYRGVIVDAFIVHKWLPATETYFPGREAVPGRFGFVGEDAPPHIKALYVGKRVPDSFRKRGAANPIKYTWK